MSRLPDWLRAGNTESHYCKFCETNFKIQIGEKETGDFFLICPKCSWNHYRRFENGVAVHCDINKRKGTPFKLQGK